MILSSHCLFQQNKKNKINSIKNNILSILISIIIYHYSKLVNKEIKDEYLF